MRRFASASLILVAACAGAGDGDETTATDAPLVGVDGSLDQADRNCHVVLREVARSGSGSSLETSGSSWVWGGALEISNEAAAEGLVPAVMYRMAPSGTWATATATASSAAATPGFTKFTFRISQNLPGPGWSGTALSHAKIEVVPYLPLAQGGRLFDHNRHASDFDNYGVASPDWAVFKDPTACAPAAGATRAQLVFGADWSERRDGVLAPGGEMAIVYDTSRLAQCKSTQGGLPQYDITANVTFAPGNQKRAISVRDTAPTIAVPSDARSVSIYFEATSVHGCHVYDSNSGANYAFDALVPPQWAGEVRTLITRDASDPCDGGGTAAQSFLFDTWARQRAWISNLCFQAYQPGMTDHDDPDLWQKLDAKLHYRYIGATASTEWQTAAVNLDRRVGNNARYAINWRGIDPLRTYHCPEVAPTITPTADGGRAEIRVEYYVSINGGELRPQPGAAYAGTFVDYANEAFRAANCQ